MDLLRFRSQVAAMGQAIPDSHCSHCGSPTPVERDRLGRLTCAKCDPLDPLKSDRAKGWLQGELRPPK
jgi:uncharacterized Zn finger protein (UPF0148 family)